MTRPARKEISDDVLRLYEAGFGTNSIAHQLGVWPMRVWRELKRKGVQIRPASARPAVVRQARAAALHPASLAARLERRLEYDPNSGCHLWSGNFSGAGLKDHLRYGDFTVAGRHLRPHRVAWELAHGQIAHGLFVCHRCDTPACCNPDHLFLGTAAENNADKSAKGRNVAPVGEQSGNAKLNRDAVLDIRRQVAAGVKRSQICRQYGVSRSAICDIVKGRRWRHLPPAEAA